jgi:integrase/recombinase XerD
MLLHATADDAKYYKRALLEAGLKRTTVSRRLSVLRGAFKQFADKGLISWDAAQAIAAIEGPPLGRDERNTTPCLTQKQGVALLEAIPTDTLQGVRDFALMSAFFITGCRVSAIIGACVGHLETDGVEHYLHVTEKRGKRRRKILLDAARAVLAYIERAGIAADKEGPLFRPMHPNGLSLRRRPLDRKTPWRLVKKYCVDAGIDPTRLGGRGIGVHSLRKTAINDAIRNGAQMHEVREFAGHSDIRTTELYFARHSDDAEAAARRIQIRAGRAWPK